MKKDNKLDANGHRKFGIRDSIAYAAGDLGCNMSFALKGTMALFWTQVMGMSAWYSLLLVIVQFWMLSTPPLSALCWMPTNASIREINSCSTYLWVLSVLSLAAHAASFSASTRLG